MFRRIWVAALAAVLAVAAAQAASAGTKGVTVMTYNLYQGTNLEQVVGATGQLELIQGVASVYDNVVATNFVERANAIAAEIAAEQPDVVGLQEVALWKTQFPYDPSAEPGDVSYDFLSILLAALRTHGMSYAPVVTHTDWNATAPGLFPFGLMGVSLTETGAIIARTDLPRNQLELSNPRSGAYKAVTTLPLVSGPFPVGESWLSVDVKAHGEQTFRFVTTHLDPFSADVRSAQASELLADPLDTKLAVVLTGDLNSTPDTQAYATLTSRLSDTWLRAHPGDPGFTCCQSPPDSIDDPVSQLNQRVDYVLADAKTRVLDEHLVGDTPASRTASGLWPSDHAGVVATLEPKK